MSNSWVELLSGGQSIKAIYGEKTPSLDQIELHSIFLHRDGARAVLTFDIRELPNTIPEKWDRVHINKVQLSLMAIGIKDLELSGWNEKGIVDMKILRADKGVEVQICASDISMKLVALSVFVEKISAYRDEV